MPWDGFPVDGHRSSDHQLSKICESDTAIFQFPCTVLPQIFYKHDLKQYSEISGWLKHPFLWHPSIDSLCSKSHGYTLYDFTLVTRRMAN